MKQDFHGDFQVNVTWFFASFSGVLDWIVLILVWFERSLHSAQVSGQSCPWPLKLMTSQRVERTWIRTDSYGRFRGEWVKLRINMKISARKVLRLPSVSYGELHQPWPYALQHQCSQPSLWFQQQMWWSHQQHNPLQDNQDWVSWSQ